MRIYDRKQKQSFILESTNKVEIKKHRKRGEYNKNDGIEDEKYSKIEQE